MANKIIIKFLLFITAVLIASSGVANAQWMQVKHSTPPRGAKNIPLNQTISITFSEPLNNAQTPTNILIEMPSKSAVPVKAYFSDDGKTLFLQPKEPLKRGTYYVISLAGIFSRGGRGMHVYQNNIDFTTEGGQFFCVAYATPSESYLPPGGFRDVVYSFIEQGGGWGEIMRSQLIYEDSTGHELFRNTEQVKLIIPDKQTLKFSSSISMPKDLGEKLLGQTIYIRRVFEGIDHDNNQISLRTGVKVTVGSSPSSIPTANVSSTDKSLYVSAPEYGSVIPKNSLITAEGIIQGKPQTEVHGCWLFNGTPMGFFASAIPDSGNLKQSYTDKIFAASEGRFNIALQLISPNKTISEKIEYIVSKVPINHPMPLYPKAAQIFTQNELHSLKLKWSIVPGALSYKVTMSNSRTLNNAVWITTHTNIYKPDILMLDKLRGKTVYWSVKPVFPGNKEGEAFNPAQFILN